MARFSIIAAVAALVLAAAASAEREHKQLIMNGKVLKPTKEFHPKLGRADLGEHKSRRMLEEGTEVSHIKVIDHALNTKLINKETIQHSVADPKPIHVDTSSRALLGEKKPFKLNIGDSHFGKADHVEHLSGVGADDMHFATEAAKKSLSKGRALLQDAATTSLVGKHISAAQLEHFQNGDNLKAKEVVTKMRKQSRSLLQGAAKSLIGTHIGKVNHVEHLSDMGADDVHFAKEAVKKPTGKNRALLQDAAKSLIGTHLGKANLQHINNLSKKTMGRKVEP